MSSFPSRRLLDLRPVSAVKLLPPRSEACPLSLRYLLRGPAREHRPLPLVSAPHPTVARAALLAAKEAASVIGFGLPRGSPPEPWFDAIACAADELAPRLPFFLSAEIAVDAGAIEQAVQQAHRLVECGVTHLAIDVLAVPVAERPRAAAEVAQPARERELAVECLLPGLTPDAALARGFLEELLEWGLAPDALGRRAAPAAAGGAAARGDARALAAESAALAPAAIVCRGRTSAALLPVLGRLGVAVVEDGGAVWEAGLRRLAPSVRARASGAYRREQRPPAQLLAADAFDEVEGRVYLAVAAFIDGLGSSGTAELAEAARGERR